MSRRADPFLERLRSADPARWERIEATSPSARRMLATIVAQPAGQPRPRRSLVAGVTVGLLLFMSAAAVAGGAFAPDPGDVAAVEEDVARSGVQVAHGPGWRPELSSELVWCMAEPTRGSATYVSEFALGEELTHEHLLAECRSGNDAVRSSGVEPTEFTVCEGMITERAVAARLAATEETIVEGRLQEQRPGFPVVLGWEASCADTELPTSVEVRLRPLASLTAMNAARQLEITSQATALRSCLTKEQALAEAREARRRLGPEWLVLDGPETAQGCHRLRIDSEWGVLSAVAARVDGG